jgi:hypothetical protein
MMNRLLATILIGAASGSVTAQAMTGTMMTRSPVFDLVTMITALVQMENTTEHPLDPQQAATMLETLQELHGAPELAPGQAEEVLELVRDTLTPQQLEWVQAFATGPAATPGGLARGQRMTNPAANPFAQPPLSTDLEGLLVLLLQTTESQDDVP